MKNWKKLSLLLLITLLSLNCITAYTQSKPINLISKITRTKYKNDTQNKYISWTKWYTSKCNIPIYIVSDTIIVTTESKNPYSIKKYTSKYISPILSTPMIKETFIIKNKHTIYKKTVEINWYTSEDSRGKKLFIAIYKYKNSKQYKISFMYDLCKYDYVCSLK